MKLRVLLVVTLLAGVAVVMVGQFILRPHIQGIITQRDQNAQDRDQQKSARFQAETKLADREARLAATTQILEKTRTDLATSHANLEKEQKRAAGLQSDLRQTRADKLAAEQALARWNATGFTVEQVLAARKTVEDLQVANQLLGTTNQFLAQRVKYFEDLLGPYPPPPPNLQGHVVAVDPKWHFVVLDIGDAENAKPTWTFLVSRDGKLVGKVQIVSVQGERSIANVLPGWDLASVLEGDFAIPAVATAPSN